MDVTKDFQTFVDSIFDMDYHEIYELYQAASGNEGSISLYRVETANGSDDTLIIHEASNNALRLTPKAKEYFPKWIEENLMKGFDDAESFYAIQPRDFLSSHRYLFSKEVLYFGTLHAFLSLLLPSVPHLPLVF